MEKSMTTKKTKPEAEVVPLKIVKPTGGFLEKYRAKKAPTIGGVETLLTPLPIMKLSDARDFVKVSADEDYWSPELCFVSVPIQGEKRDMLHLIDEELALQYLPANKIRRFRLVLATKPYDVFFLAQLPTMNLDNSWNSSALKAFEQAKVNWVCVTSRKAEGAEAYKIDAAQDLDAFPDPKWPSRSLEQLIETTFHGAQIETADHPALLRLIGARQTLK
jgi:hypothetical protein